MPSKPILRIAGVILFVTTLFTLTLLHAAPTTSNAPNASLLFLGLTNSPTGPLATFVLSNGTPAHIACVPEAFERRTNQTWLKTPLLGQWRITRKWINLPEELHPNQTATFKVPVPYTNCAWRLIFLCQEQKPITDRAADLVRHITTTNAAQSTTRQFSGRHYSITSPDVNQ